MTRALPNRALSFFCALGAGGSSSERHARLAVADLTGGAIGVGSAAARPPGRSGRQRSRARIRCARTVAEGRLRALDRDGVAVVEAFATAVHVLVQIGERLIEALFPLDAQATRVRLFGGLGDREPMS